MEAQFEIPPIRPSAAVKRTPDVGPFGVIDTMRYVYFILFFWFITIGFERKEKVATYGYSILMIYVKLGLSLSGLHVLLYMDRLQLNQRVLCHLVRTKWFNGCLLRELQTVWKTTVSYYSGEGGREGVRGWFSLLCCYRISKSRKYIQLHYVPSKQCIKYQLVGMVSTVRSICTQCPLAGIVI